jgi:2-methylcitrate dehydratase PrpD
VDATGQHGTGHYAATTVPTALSTGQYVGASGQEFIALAAVYGEITFQHIHDPSYREDPRVKAFRDRARLLIILRPEPASMGQRLDMSLTVRTRSGEVLRQELQYPLMTEAEIQQKFRDLVGLRLESRRVADLERQLKAIAYVENVAPLIRELELDSWRPQTIMLPGR